MSLNRHANWALCAFAALLLLSVSVYAKNPYYDITKVSSEFSNDKFLEQIVLGNDSLLPQNAVEIGDSISGYDVASGIVSTTALIERTQLLKWMAKESDASIAGLVSALDELANTKPWAASTKVSQKLAKHGLEYVDEPIAGTKKVIFKDPVLQREWSTLFGGDAALVNISDDAAQTTKAIDRFTKVSLVQRWIAKTSAEDVIRAIARAPAGAKFSSVNSVIDDAIAHGAKIEKTADAYIFLDDAGRQISGLDDTVLQYYKFVDPLDDAAKNVVIPALRKSHNVGKIPVVSRLRGLAVKASQKGAGWIGKAGAATAAKFPKFAAVAKGGGRFLGKAFTTVVSVPVIAGHAVTKYGAYGGTAMLAKETYLKPPQVKSLFENNLVKYYIDPRLESNLFVVKNVMEGFEADARRWGGHYGGGVAYRLGEFADPSDLLIGAGQWVHGKGKNLIEGEKPENFYIESCVIYAYYSKETTEETVAELKTMLKSATCNYSQFFPNAPNRLTAENPNILSLPKGEFVLLFVAKFNDEIIDAFYDEKGYPFDHRYLKKELKKKVTKDATGRFVVTGGISKNLVKQNGLPSNLEHVKIEVTALPPTDPEAVVITLTNIPFELIQKIASNPPLGKENILLKDDSGTKLELEITFDASANWIRLKVEDPSTLSDGVKYNLELNYSKIDSSFKDAKYESSYSASNKMFEGITKVE